MFVAKNQLGKIVNVLEDELEKGDYTCPACQGAVRLRQGRVMRTHFAHKRLEACHFYSENESSEHLSLKASFYRWAKKNHVVAIEQHLPAIQQIADVWVEKKLALEVQCSPLSQVRLAERTVSYRQEGYQVLWLLGEKLWLKDSLTSLQRDFLSFSQSLGFYLWEADEKEQMLRLKYLIHEDLHGKVHCKVKVFPFGKGDLLAVLRFPFKQTKLQSLQVAQDRDICAFVRKQLYFQVPKWMKRQEVAYLTGDNLLNWQTQDFYPQVSPPQQDSFCQIIQDISWYQQAFARYYKEQDPSEQQMLYSPAFYRYFFEKNSP